MIGRYEAYMDGTALSSIDDKILVLDIKYTPATVQRKTERLANRPGARAYGKTIGSAQAVITFEIHEYDTVKRQEICDKITAWANGMYLRTSDKAWKRMRCVCDKYPSVQSKKWTEPVTMTFSAYNPPFWQDMNPVVLTLGGTSGATSGSGSVFVPGNAEDSLVSVTVTAKAGISSLSLTANGNTFSFSGLSLSSGDTVTIGYDDDLMLSIKKGNTSIMGKRAASSADDLKVNCGKSNAFSFTADGAAVVTFSARGWWY